MAIIKCKMCGGDLRPEDGATTCECEYCGSVQTIPTADNEKKMALFSRAQRLLRACEFDKAAGIYEAIVAEFPQEAEGYWGLVLCKFGIEYVDDPGTGRKVPTCHRSSFDSVMDDPDFEQACENADPIARRVYREDAKEIEGLRRHIIEVSNREEPYDIFICYKETDTNGDRTLDSEIAQDIYNALVEKGYRVFFARISLEDKLGQEYEPYIFAALNSAKIMLAVGTDYEHYNAVWVKNEWSRFLKLKAAGKNKSLIPCYKNIDAYDMPKEFARLQAQDMGKIGAMQDLLRGIEKYIPRKAPAAQPAPVLTAAQLAALSGNPTVNSLLKRAYLFLEDGEWDNADQYAEKVLDAEPTNGQAYFVKLLVEQKLHTADELGRLDKPFDSAPMYAKVMRFGDDALKTKVSGYINAINTACTEREQAKRMSEQTKRLDDLKEKLGNAVTVEKVVAIRDGLMPYGNTEGLEALRKVCNDKASSLIRQRMNTTSTLNTFILLYKQIESLGHFDGSSSLRKACDKKIVEIARLQLDRIADFNELGKLRSDINLLPQSDEMQRVLRECDGKIPVIVRRQLDSISDFEALKKLISIIEKLPQSDEMQRVLRECDGKIPVIARRQLGSISDFEALKKLISIIEELPQSDEMQRVLIECDRKIPVIARRQLDSISDFEALKKLISIIEELPQSDEMQEALSGCGEKAAEITKKQLLEAGNIDAIDKLIQEIDFFQGYGSLDALRLECCEKARKLVLLKINTAFSLDSLDKLASVVDRYSKEDNQGILRKAYSEKALEYASCEAFQETDPGKLPALEALFKRYMNEDCYNALHALCTKIATCLESIAKDKADFKARQAEWQTEHTMIQQLSSEREQTQSRREATARRVLSLQEEIRNLRGLFSGKRRRELEEAVEKEKLTLRQIDSNLSDLERRLVDAKQACPEAVDERELTYLEAKVWFDAALANKAAPLLASIQGYRDVDDLLKDTAVSECLRQAERLEQARKRAEAERLMKNEGIRKRLDTLRAEQNQRRSEAKHLEQAHREAESQHAEPDFSITPQSPDIALPEGCEEALVRSQRFTKDLHDQVFCARSQRDAEYLVDQAIAFLKRKDRPYRLVFLDNFMNYIVQNVLPAYAMGKSTTQCEYLFGVGSRIANECCWDALFHRTTLNGSAPDQLETATRCIESLARMGRAEVIDPDVGKDLVEWQISCAVFNGEHCDQQRLIERLKCIDGMDRKCRMAYRQDLSILAVDCAKYIDSVDDRLFRCSVTALFYANMRFNGIDLRMNTDNLDMLLDQIHDKSVARAYRNRLTQIYKVAAGAWATNDHS